jgi:hypothetical protein
VSTAFQGKNTVARHRMIYDAVGELMRKEIHALAIQARSPEENDSNRNIARKLMKHRPEPSGSVPHRGLRRDPRPRRRPSPPSTAPRFPKPAPT